MALPSDKTSEKIGKFKKLLRDFDSTEYLKLSISPFNKDGEQSNIVKLFSKYGNDIELYDIIKEFSNLEELSKSPTGTQYKRDLAKKDLDFLKELLKESGFKNSLSELNDLQKKDLEQKKNLSINAKITDLKTMVEDKKNSVRINSLTANTLNEIKPLLNKLNNKDINQNITDSKFLEDLASILEKLEKQKSKDIQLIKNLLTECGLPDTSAGLREELNKFGNPPPAAPKPMDPTHEVFPKPHSEEEDLFTDFVGHKPEIDSELDIFGEFQKEPTGKKVTFSEKNTVIESGNQKKANEEAASLNPDTQPSKMPEPEPISKAALFMDAESSDKNKYAGHIPEEKYNECMKHKELEAFNNHIRNRNVWFLSNEEDKVGNQKKDVGKIVIEKTTNAEATQIAHAILKTHILREPTFTVKATDRAAAIALAKQCEQDGIHLSRIIVNDAVYEGPKAIQEFLVQKSSTLSEPLKQVENKLATPPEISGTGAPAPVVHSPIKTSDPMDWTDADKEKKEAKDTLTPNPHNPPKHK